MLGEPEKRPPRQLKLDLDELAFAFENWAYEHQYYLDLEMGEVVMVTEETRRELEDIYEELSSEEDEEATRFMEALGRRGLHDWQKQALVVADQVERGFGSRFIRVPSIESHEAYGDMEDYFNTVGSQRLQERLWDAIRGRGAFRRFKEVLSEYPRERERWFQFKDDQMGRRVLNWLEEEGVQPVEQED